MPENTAKPRKKPWTVLVYMVADDPQGGELLDQQANRELDQIIYATLGIDRADLNVAVQIDYRSQRDVWRRIIGRGTWKQPESNAADPETLYGFFNWAKDACPAERYLLMFWGHSRGPFGLFTDGDDWKYVAQTLTLPELRTALQAAVECIKQPIDIVVFKDCYMSTLETAFELKDLATFVVASQALVPIEGWPYREMFEGLANQKDPQKAAVKIVNDLEEHYSDKANRGGHPDVPYSVLDTRRVPMVAGPLETIVKGLADTRGNGQYRKRVPKNPGCLSTGKAWRQSDAGRRRVVSRAEASPRPGRRSPKSRG